jgi:hypothetical protein
MNRSVWARLKQSLAAAEQWYRGTPERALNEAYEAAQAITRLETQYANGQTIDLSIQAEGAVSTYLQAQINKYLKIIRMRLTEYRFCSPVVSTEPKLTPRAKPNKPQQTIQTSPRQTSPPGRTVTEATGRSPVSNGGVIEISASTVDVSRQIQSKLEFIDAVLTRYEPWRLPPPANTDPSGAATLPPPLGQNNQPPQALRSVQDVFDGVGSSGKKANSRNTTDGNSFIPRSIFSTVNRVRRQIDPNPQSEEEVVRDFRSARLRTRAATRFLLLLVILPLLTQQLSKAVLVGPIIDRWQDAAKVEALLNPRVEQRMLAELVEFEERLRFESLLADIPRSSTAVELAMRDKAKELKESFQKELKAPLKNIVADFLSLLVFAGLVFTGKQEIATLKSFMDEVVYGLSDSAKAFIIILFTDVFVGFHSPHGWEVVMETVFDHFGLPANQNFINVFIATFPVMLDTVFKYWIFRYLNQISPSAVATYKNMNE